MTFLFDIGNVIMHFDFAPAIAHYVNNSTNDITDPLSEVADIKDRLEGGEMGSEEFVTHAIDTFGYRGTREEFIKAWNEIFSENAPMVAAIEAIAKAGHPLYLLSNTNGLHMDFLLTFDVFKHFKGGIYSHEAKCMKPADKIYEIAIEEFDLDPSKTIYIDDLPANAEAGTRLGFLTHQYDSAKHEEFLAFVNGYGIAL